jgi:hypothetical protein
MKTKTAELAKKIGQLWQDAAAQMESATTPEEIAAARAAIDAAYVVSIGATNTAAAFAVAAMGSAAAMTSASSLRAAAMAHAKSKLK